MVHRCCISSCKMNVRVAEAKGLSYHCFPLKDPHREKWIQAILPHVEKPESFKVVQGYTRVCSRHFRLKEYSMDSKKRARLNSNAVPSVFPRKTSPVIVQTPIEARKAKADTEASQCNIDKVVDIKHETSDSAAVVAAGESDDFLNTVLVESATSSNDQMILDLLNAVSVEGGCSDQNSSVAGSQSDEVNSDDSCDDKQEQSKRKRRKWNRTAFASCSKSKQKKSHSPSAATSATEDVRTSVLDDEIGDLNLVSTLLDEFSRNNSIDLEAELCLDKVNLGDPDDAKACPDVTQLQLTIDPGISHSASSVSCLSVGDNLQSGVLNLSSVEEQELLQSIRAVSLDSGEAEMNMNMRNIHIDPNDFVPVAPLSSSVAFSCDTSAKPVLSSIFVVGEPANSTATNVSTTRSTSDARKRSVSRKASLHDKASGRTPSASEIEKLASEFHLSLLTSPSLPETFDLNLSDHELSLPVDAFPESVHTKESDGDGNLTAPEKKLQKVDRKIEEDTCTKDIVKIEPKVTKGNQKKNSVLKSKLVGISKKPKAMDKCFGKFSVERFKDCDKDIEYYTSFPSFTHFEAFFNSLESHVEKLKVTDIMHGVADLIRKQAEPIVKDEASSGDEPKRRPTAGRSMSRIDELFMTLIRLKRRLPEKVLGHMFYVSQPTVSRTVRAWTMLLSKLLQPMPIPAASVVSNLAETTPSKQPQKISKCSSEHNYFTNRGIYVPESFRQLFLSDLATSIIASPHTPRSNGSLLTSSPKSSSVNVNNNIYDTEIANGNKNAASVASNLTPCAKCALNDSSCQCFSSNIRNMNNFKSEVVGNVCVNEKLEGLQVVYLWT